MPTVRQPTYTTPAVVSIASEAVLVRARARFPRFQRTSKCSRAMHCCSVVSMAPRSSARFRGTVAATVITNVDTEQIPAAMTDVEIAATRLREEDITAARLADELGYRSEAAFNRAFHRVNGQTPGSIRRQRRLVRASPALSGAHAELTNPRSEL